MAPTAVIAMLKRICALEAIEKQKKKFFLANMGVQKERRGEERGKHGLFTCHDMQFQRFDGNV